MQHVIKCNKINCDFESTRREAFEILFSDLDRIEGSPLS